MALLRVTAYIKASSPQFVPLQAGDTRARVDQFSIKPDWFAARPASRVVDRQSDVD